MITSLIKLQVLGWIGIIILAVVTSACDSRPLPVKGFVLPQGDLERGKEVFTSTGCRYCHTVANEEFPPFEADPVLSIELGGEVYRIKNYGELLTSIVNPNHFVSAKYRATLDEAERKDAQSPMPEFNDVLNVTQLIDLTEYLHSRYELLAPQYRGYYYGP
jgi:sulfur-oxidizing protein SoxX